MPRIRRKYGNKIFTCDEGIKWQSKWEYNCWTWLKELQTDGIISDLKRQYVVPISINGVFICKCILDFYFIWHKDDGSIQEVYADSKSVITNRMFKFVIQRNLLKAVYDVDVVILMYGKTDVKKMFTSFSQ